MNQTIVDQTKVSQNMQTYIPKKIQSHLNLSSNQSISWIIVDNKVYVQKSSSSQSIIDSSRGAAKSLYKKYGGGEKWLQQDRQSWKQSA